MNLNLDWPWKYTHVANFLGDINTYQDYLSLETRKSVLNFFSESNKKLAEEFLDREDDTLFYEKNSEYDEYPGLSAEKAMRIFYELVSINNQASNKLFLKTMWYSVKGCLGNNPRKFIQYSSYIIFHQLRSYVSYKKELR